MSAPVNSVVDLLKQLRRERKLTQVQLANEAGLSPATIYRYESGARPDAAALLALLRVAEKTGSSAIVNSFREAVAQRVALPGDPSVFIRMDGIDEVPAESKGLALFITRIAAQLSERERLQMLAFVVMLRENKDLTAERMLDVILSPWIERANKEFGLKTPEQMPAKAPKKK